MIIAYDDGFINLACHPNTWVIDSNTSYHVTSHDEFFTSYKSGNYGFVRMENEGSFKTLAIRDIFLKKDKL